MIYKAHSFNIDLHDSFLNAQKQAATFSDAMNESLKEAEKAVEAGEKEATMAKAAPPAIEAPKAAPKKVDISDV